MQVKAIRPRGYCKGVVRAIEMAKQARGEKQPVVILGMIVHNQYIVDALDPGGNGDHNSSRRRRSGI